MLSAHFCVLAQYLPVVVTTVPHFYHIMVAICTIPNAVLCFSIGACFVPIFYMVLMQTYPKNPSFVILHFVGACQCRRVVVFGESYRLLLKYTNVIAMFSFILSLLLFTLIISVFVKPNYNRFMAFNFSQNQHKNMQLLNYDYTIEINSSKQKPSSQIIFKSTSNKLIY